MLLVGAVVEDLELILGVDLARLLLAQIQLLLAQTGQL
jgi:hypothetical protein